jgi:hypothetical protein
MKQKSLLPLALILSAVLFGIATRRRPGRSDPSKAERSLAGQRPRMPVVISQTDLAMRRYTTYFLLPLWIVPGLLDYVWHRRTKIESTSGLPESVSHSLMLAEVGVPLLAGLLLEINAGVLGLMIGGFLLHEATAIWDVTYTARRRPILPMEQHTHSFLDVLPFCGLSFVICMHWDQFLALTGQAKAKPCFNIRLKRPPLPPRYLASIFTAIAIFLVLPYGEELIRCWRARTRGEIDRDTPECLRILSPQVTQYADRDSRSGGEA